MTDDRAPDAVFVTPRLVARRWRDGDIDALLAVYGDADAMRWVGDGEPITAEECAQWLVVTRANYAKRGYGMFALEDREGGEVIGFCGIVHPGGQPEPEVKYALARSRWGGGLATEAVTGIIACAHRAHALTHLIATTAPQNAASHRVLIKAGFRCAELRDNGDGTHTQVFRWTCESSAA